MIAFLEVYKMKKFAALLLAVAMLFTLVACGPKTENNDNNDNNDQQVEIGRAHV